MTRLLAFLAAVGVLSLTIAALGAPSADASPATDARAIRAGLAGAVHGGRLTASESRRHRETLARARSAIRALPSHRAVPLARVLHLVRLQASRFNHARAEALFGMLRQNAVYLRRRGLPRDGTDVIGAQGVLYRAGWGYGLQFHPLGNVIRLNTLLYAGKRTKALRLAAALRDRLVNRPRGAAWEYYFPYGGGSPPWTSGMAQAIGAQALARTGRRLGVPAYFAPAGRAYDSIPGRLVQALDAGPWIRLYSFSSMTVLNAQLQAALSVADYGRITDHPEAMGLGDRLENTARARMGRYDTGAWTNYIPGKEAPLKYHLYHVDLANWLAQRTKAEFWVDAHARFDRYSHEPPRFRSGKAVPTLFPWPADGFRDRTRIRFFLSKISTVRVGVAGRSWYLGQRPRGWYSVIWSPGHREARVYYPRVSAVDLAGNRGTSLLRGIRISVDRTPPEVTASVTRRTLHWSVVDRTSPWVRLRVRLERAGVVRHLDLGRRPKAGSLRLAVPRGTHDAILAVFDSTGNRTRVPLGKIPVPAD